MVDEKDPAAAGLGYKADAAGVEAETFAQNPHCIVAGAGHPLAKKRHISWDALKDEPFLFREPQSATRQFF
jgi:DNA-binding transcriptional LysR family regulator